MSHEFFIWASYGVSFAALALEVVFLLRRARRCKVDVPQKGGAPAR
jgi:heme exporter protein CcmD